MKLISFILLYFSRKWFLSVLHLFFPQILPVCAKQCCDSLAYVCPGFRLERMRFSKESAFGNLYLYLIYLYPSP